MVSHFRYFSCRTSRGPRGLPTEAQPPHPLPGPTWHNNLQYQKYIYMLQVEHNMLQVEQNIQ